MHDAPELFMMFCLMLSGYVGAYLIYRQEQKRGIIRELPTKLNLSLFVQM